MRAKLFRLMKRVATLLVACMLTLLAVRACDAQRGPPLKLWHTYLPQELRAKELDTADWPEYLAAEDSVFDGVRREVTQKLDAEDRAPFNRYFDGSSVYPGGFPQDWNRSYLLEPIGAPVGAAVFLHGLTDSPYSLRHIARYYREQGFICVAIRLPAHGTVPGALTDVKWEDWMAATRLAVREAKRRTGPSLPLHLVGFSNGGALALKYALDAIDDRNLAKPDRLVLISPMIGVTRFARFAGLAGLPAILPAFSNAAWLSVLPEFNPFKYNSFPVSAARQSYRLTASLQQQIALYARQGRLVALPPVLTFQSVVDSTVSTRAVISALYAHLPSNGSELVLFDVNRNIKSILLLRPTSDTALAQILPPPPRRYKTTVISNAAPERSDAIANIVEAGGLTEYSEELGLYYPPDIFSLSHVALPFPPSDGLYGLEPDPSEHFGISFGTIAKRGERGALIVGLDSLLRIASNPFFSYVLEKIAEGIGPHTNVPPNPTESSATPPQPPQTPFGAYDDRTPERLEDP